MMKTMKSYLIKGALYLLSYLSNHFPMNRVVDDFASLLSPNLVSDIVLFVACYVQFAMDSGAAIYFLRERFMVSEIGINKAGPIFQHESLAVWFVDKLDSKDYTVVIERTPSKRLNTSFPSGCPEANKILQVIRDILHTREDTDNIPLIPLSTTSSASSEPVSVSTSAYVPRMNLVDQISSTLAGAAASASLPSQSSSSNLARDQITGASSLNPANCIKRFKPQGLSLFDLVLVALVLHLEAPFYTLFRNQCYFFANVLFQTIVQIYSLIPSSSTLLPAGLDLQETHNPGPDPVPVPTIVKSLPKDANILILPLDFHGNVGRCMGIMINDPIVISTVVANVMGKFKTRLSSQIEKVIFITYDLLPTKSPTGDSERSGNWGNLKLSQLAYRVSSSVFYFLICVRSRLYL